jgi:hypothetical protein
MAAADAATLRYADWETQAQGDALFAVLPEGVSEPALVDTFMRALEAGLRNHNESRVPQARLRLRAAVHYGPASRGDLGFVGPGPVELARLNASNALKTALAQAPDAHLAVGVSTPIYVDVIHPGYTTLRAEQFRQAEVVEKEYRGSVWIWMPGVPGTLTEVPAPAVPPITEQYPANQNADQACGSRHSPMIVTRVMGNGGVNVAGHDLIMTINHHG